MDATDLPIDELARPEAPALQRFGLAIAGWLESVERRTGLPVQRAALKLATLARLPWYLVRLGAREGLSAWVAFLFGRSTVRVRVPGYAHPIAVRCGGTDPTVFERIFIADEYAPVRDLDRCGVILDCGAYVGYSTLYFARHFPDATIVAVEPDEDNVARLRDHTSHHANVVVVNAALWSKSCGVRIANPDAASWSFTVEEGGALPAVTVDHLLSEHGLGGADLVKMDIEGAEHEVFKEGWESWLPRVRMLVIELHDQAAPGSSRTFFEAIAGLAFSMRARGENLVLTAKR